jgi:hypothetical protein
MNDWTLRSILQHWGYLHTHGRAVWCYSSGKPPQWRALGVMDRLVLPASLLPVPSVPDGDALIEVADPVSAGSRPLPVLPAELTVRLARVLNELDPPAASDPLALLGRAPLPPAPLKELLTAILPLAVPTAPTATFGVPEIVELVEYRAVPPLTAPTDALLARVVLLPALTVVAEVIVGEGGWLLLSAPEATATDMLPASRLDFLRALAPATAAAVEATPPATAPLLLWDDPSWPLREVGTV